MNHYISPRTFRHCYAGQGLPKIPKYRLSYVVQEREYVIYHNMANHGLDARQSVHHSKIDPVVPSVEPSATVSVLLVPQIR